MQEKIDTSPLEFAEQADEIRQGPPQPIDAPGCHEINLASGHRPEHRIEPRPAIVALGPGDAVIAEDRRDVPAGAGGDLVERAGLVLRALAIGRGDPDGKGDPLHPLQTLTDPKTVKPSLSQN